eukprot:3867879-Ditylum_brightwellii.AAC.1
MKQVYWTSFLKGRPREDSRDGEQLRWPIAPKTNLLRNAELQLPARLSSMMKTSRHAREPRVNIPREQDFV